MTRERQSRRQISLRTAALWLLGIIVICQVIYTGLAMLPPETPLHDIVRSSRDLSRTDMDIRLNLASLLPRRTFSSTFVWWHTAWQRGVPYWRPLSMQTFWVENHFFTTDRYDLWRRVSVAVHFACIAAFGWFVLLLTRRPLVMWIALSLFAGWRPGLDPSDSVLSIIANVPALNCVGAWKDQPDLFADTFLFLCLALVLSRRYYASILCAFIAIAFKESGWMCFPMAGILLLQGGRWREVPKAAYACAFGVIALLICLRMAAGPEVMHGYNCGSNRSWPSRYMHDIGGSYTLVMFSAVYCWILGNAIAVSTMLRRRLASIGVLVAGLIAAFIVQCRVLGEPIDLMIASWLDPKLGFDMVVDVIAVTLSVWSVKLAVDVRRNRSAAAVAGLGMLITALPAVAATQVLEHALHQSYAFQSLWWAIAVAGSIDIIRANKPRLRVLPASFSSTVRQVEPVNPGR